MKEEKPAFIVNTVLPNANIGHIFDKSQARSTGQWTVNLFKGEGLDGLKFIPPREQSNY